MTAGILKSMASDEGKAHTRILRLPTVDNTPVKHLQPPAVVVTADDSDTMGSPRRIPMSKSLVFSEKIRPDVAEFRALSARRANGTIPGRQESADSSSPEAVTLGLTPTTPCDQQTGDAMLDNRDTHREAQPYVQVTRRTCFTEHRKRMSCGLFLTSFVAVSWVGGTHLLRAMYVDYSQALAANALKMNLSASLSNMDSVESKSTKLYPLYNAPFFTTWVCTTLNFFFYPLYLISRLCAPASEKTSFKKELTDSLQPYQERGLSLSRFLCRCCTFTVLWVTTNYMFVYSLTLLDATDVIALYTTNVAFIYLLSWVLLQEQFVGIRIVAVIMCNTGMALFAYMDGVSRALTLGGVVLAAAAAAGTAVYKVLFKKFIGEVSLNQLSFFFSLVGVCNVLMMWPIFLALYFTNMETIYWNDVPWLPLVGAALFIFLANLLGNFGVMWTYEVFLTLGFLFAVPASAAVDVYLYSVEFRGMKLAGIVLSIIGFCLVLLPENWPDYLTIMLRWRRNKYPHESSSCNPETRTSYTSRLRTQSGRVK